MRVGFGSIEEYTSLSVDTRVKRRRICGSLESYRPVSLCVVIPIFLHLQCRVHHLETSITDRPKKEGKRSSLDQEQTVSVIIRSLDSILLRQERGPLNWEFVFRFPSIISQLGVCCHITGFLRLRGFIDDEPRVSMGAKKGWVLIR